MLRSCQWPTAVRKQTAGPSGCARDDKGGDGASSQYPMVAEAVPCPSILADFQPPLSMEAPPPPLSSRPGFPATQCWTKPRLRLSLKERRMECAKATNLNRKSGGAQPRDLRFSRPYLEMFVGLSSRLIGSSFYLPRPCSGAARSPPNRGIGSARSSCRSRNSNAEGTPAAPQRGRLQPARSHRER